MNKYFSVIILILCLYCTSVKNENFTEIISLNAYELISFPIFHENVIKLNSDDVFEIIIRNKNNTLTNEYVKFVEYYIHNIEIINLYNANNHTISIYYQHFYEPKEINNDNFFDPLSLLSFIFLLVLI
jgi:hypothetical protein